MQDLALDWRWVEFVALSMSSLAALLFLSTILMRHRRNHHAAKNGEIASPTPTGQGGGA